MTVHDTHQAPSRSTLLTFLVGALLAAVVGVGAMVAFGVSQLVDAVPTPADLVAALAPEPYEKIGPVVVESVRDLASLTTVEMVEFTIVEKGTDQGWLEWARGDRVRLMAVAAIGAGVDLAAVQTSDFRLSDDGVVTVTLPHAELQYVDVDEEATQVIDRQKGLLTKGEPQLESETRRLADTILTQSALDKGILEQAEENASTAISSFLLGLGYSRVIVDFDR